jgi:uncharacterized protein (TIGR00369 family)
MSLIQNNLKNLKFVREKFNSRFQYYGKEISESLILQENQQKYEIIKDHNSEVIFKLKVEQEFCNILNVMHGGATSTLVDIATTFAISGFDRNLRHSVSIELSCYYLNPINLNSEILIHCRAPKIGKTIAYSYCDIYDYDTKKLLVNASHIKAMLEKTWNEEEKFDKEKLKF